MTFRCLTRVTSSLDNNTKLEPLRGNPVNEILFTSVNTIAPANARTKTVCTQGVVSSFVACHTIINDRYNVTGGFFHRLVIKFKPSHHA